MSVLVVRTDLAEAKVDGKKALLLICGWHSHEPDSLEWVIGKWSDRKCVGKIFENGAWTDRDAWTDAAWSVETSQGGSYETEETGVVAWAELPPLELPTD